MPQEKEKIACLTYYQTSGNFSDDTLKLKQIHRVSVYIYFLLVGGGWELGLGDGGGW